MRREIREKKKKKQKNSFINLLLITFMILALISFITIQAEDQKLPEKIQQADQQTVRVKQETKKEKKENEKEEKEVLPNQYPKEEIKEKYKGYEVEALLEIPSISLKTYILKNYSVKALKVSVTKFWGADANQIGNFCVAGHNFQNRYMFRNLKKLKVGDQFFITDPTVGKVAYRVYDVYKVKPENVDCLDQETNGKREVTLITCTNDSKQRIIVKGVEGE